MSTQRVMIRSGWRYVKTIGASGFDRYYHPTDVAIRSDGVMAVVKRHDGFVGCINVNTYDEDNLATFGRLGAEEGQLQWPCCAAFDNEGLLYVSDEKANLINVFTVEGEFLTRWGESGAGPGQLDGPSGLVFDADDNLIVSDHRKHRIQRFSRDGGYLDSWGGFGSGEGELDRPWGVAVDSEGDVYVADWRNDRVQRFSPSGEFVRSYGSGRGEFNRPSSVAVDLDGDIYVADWKNERVQVIGTDGRYVHTFTGDATLSKWALERLIASAEYAKQRFIANDPDEERVFIAPIAVKLDEEGHLFVVESKRARIQVYEKLGYPSPVAVEADLSNEPRFFAPG